MSKRPRRSGARSYHRKAIGFVAGIFFLAFSAFPSNTAFARAAGDVWGRDLNIPGLGWLGHIAIETGEWYYDAREMKSYDWILEVLNEGTVIMQNTHRNFMDRSPNWGQRFVANCERYCYHHWTSVPAAGWAQRLWSPSYTYSRYYTEGKMIRRRGKWVRRNAQYRCDSFVVYSFRKAMSLDISRVPQVPRTVWNGLPFDYSWDHDV